MNMNTRSLLAMMGLLSAMDPIGNPNPLPLLEKEPKPAKDPNSSKLLKAEQKRARRAEKKNVLKNKGE